MTFLNRFTVYKIRRDHANSTCLFIVSVPEVEQYGVGAQIRIGAHVFGVSVHTKGSDR